MENISLIELSDSYLSQMAELYREAFAGEPWNDDWSDTKQLNEYMKDISKAYNALNYGLLMEGKLVGMSVGKINHWWEGTNYNIEEFCVSPTCQAQGIGSKFLDLIATQEGYPIYKKLGFEDKVQKYTDMRLKSL